MALSQIPDKLRKNSAIASLRDFLRGFLSTRELLPLTIEDICRVCPLSNLGENGGNTNKSVAEKVDRCRKRYFATLLQSYLGKPGDEETDWLYSHQKKCEACYLSRFAGVGVTGSCLQVGKASGSSDRHYLSTASRRASDSK